MSNFRRKLVKLGRTPYFKSGHFRRKLVKLGRTPSFKSGHFRRKLVKLGRTSYLKTDTFRRKFMKLRRTSYLKTGHFRRKFMKLRRTSYLKTGHFRRKLVKLGRTPYCKSGHFRRKFKIGEIGEIRKGEAGSTGNCYNYALWKYVRMVLRKGCNRSGQDELVVDFPRVWAVRDVITELFYVLPCFGGYYRFDANLDIFPLRVRFKQTQVISCFLVVAHPVHHPFVSQLPPLLVGRVSRRTIL